MARIFAYIVHKGGIADDSAIELLAAANKIDPSASPTALVAGWGAELDAVCQTLSASYGEVWKIANQALHYPNAEVIRKALVNIVPKGSILLVPHAHFGMDLSPGLSIKLNCAYVSRRAWDRWRRRHLAKGCSPGIRRTGERSCEVRCFVGSSDQYSAGRIQAAASRAGERRRG